MQMVLLKVPSFRRSNFASDMAKQLPNIKSYVDTSVLHPGKYIRFSLSQADQLDRFFEAGKSTYFIDPYTRDKSVYITYKRDDLVNNSRFLFVRLITRCLKSAKSACD
jgi:hypothetical protein